MKIQRLPLLMLLIATTLLAPFTLLARPTLEPLGPNIADIGSAWYHFQTTTLRSADGQRRYKVWLGIPRKPAPPHGYPVLYMLDGNAAMARITEAQLKAMTKGSPPVLVAVGYDTPLPFDVRARSRDYTPPAASGSPVVEHGRYPGGGSEAFRQLLLTQIVPWAEQRAASDARKRALWGHSFGGLFVLDTLCRSSWFHDYFAAAPSLGWGNQRITQRLSACSSSQLADKRLFLMIGDGKSDRHDGPGAPGQPAEPQLIERLQRQGAALQPIRYPGKTHGELFPASLQDALQKISR